MREAKLPLIAVALILTTTVFAQDPAEKPAHDSSAKPETCTVEGTVVAAASDEPLKSASVVLAIESWNESFKQVTDASGHFIFTGLPPAEYKVRASKIGYAAEGYRLEGGPARKYLELKPGQKLDKVQFRLARGGVVIGRVTDGDGEPVAGVEIDALVPGVFMRETAMWGNAGRFAVTNDLGEYRIYGLPPGRYYLAANVFNNPELMNSDLKNGLQTNHPTLYYPGVTRSSEARKIHVQAGQEIRIDFPLGTQKLLTVSGRVVDPWGKPAIGTSVRIEPQEHYTGLLPARYEWTETDTQGYFIIKEVVPGTYVAYATTSPLVINTETEYWTEQGLEVGGDNVSGLRLRLRKQLKISGKVTVAGGPELDFDGLRVLLHDEHYRAYAGADIGKDGEFAVETVKPTRYRVTVYRLPSGYYLRSAFFGSQNVLEDGLDLGGKVHSDDLLKLTLSPDAGQVEGIVLRSDDPFPGALVRLFPEPPNPYESTFDEQTGEDGHFIIRNVPPGSYRLRAFASTADGDDDDDSQPDTEDVTRIDLAEKESKTVQLELRQSQKY